MGGDNRTLYAFTDRRTGRVGVHPGGGPGKKLLMAWGPEAVVRVATRAEAEEHWQSPLHAGWHVREDGAQHATKKYGPKASDKVARTMREFERGTLRSGSGGKVTSRQQAIAIGLAQARRAGYKVPPSPSHATTRTSAQLDREIAEALSGARRGRTAHATAASPGRSLFAVEIDRAEFGGADDLPTGARWREDLVRLAEDELARGRTHRRPKDARYVVVEWTGYRAGVGRLLDWMEGTPGITRYAEIFE